MFERFWNTWPRGLRAGKGKARRSWEKINPDSHLADQIIKAVEAQKKHRARVEKANSLLPRYMRTFVPHWKMPVTWLNQECWLDDVPSISEPPEKVVLKCTDCPGPFQVSYKDKPYCIKCYDKHAHPELSYGH